MRTKAALNRKIMVFLTIFLFCPVMSHADIKMFWIDSSGSMKKHGFNDARSILIQEVRSARPGDVLYVGHFDVNDYPIGCLQVAEDGSEEAKTELIKKLSSIDPQGIWTHLDEPLQASKALLLDERTPGNRKIVIFSDGISDVAPSHQPIDLSKIAEIIPQDLGWAVYIVGLSEDISGLLQVVPQDSEVLVNPDAPHIRGVPIDNFSSETIRQAVEVAKDDPMPQANTPLWPWIAGAVLLTAFGAALVLLVGKRNKDAMNFILEIREDGEVAKQAAVSLHGGERKTVGPRGDVVIDGNDLPPVVFTILCHKGLLWLLPQDSVTLNSKPVTAKTAISMGDLIKVRESISIFIQEGGNQDVTG